jgi:hypothetical protein
VAEPLMVSAAKIVSHTSVQWWTLAWIAGAAVAATVIIAVIVALSRRPKSMEDGMEDFSRSLQAVAPTHRAGGRPAAGDLRPSVSKAKRAGPARAARGESESV